MQTVIVPAKACIYFRWAGLGDHLSRIRSNLGGFVRSDLQGFVGWREEGPYGEDSDLYRPIVVSVPDGAVQATMLATGSWRAFPTMDYFDADGGEWSAETKRKLYRREIPITKYTTQPRSAWTPCGILLRRGIAHGGSGREILRFWKREYDCHSSRCNRAGFGDA